MPKIDWKRIEAYVLKRKGRVSPAELSRIFGPHPSTISRHKFRVAPIKKTIKRGHDASSREIVHAQALFFFGITREKIEALSGIKSETLSKHVLKLIPKSPTGQFRVWDQAALLRLVARWDQLGLDLSELERIAVLTGEILPLEESVCLKAVQKAVEFPHPEFLAAQLALMGFHTQLHENGLEVRTARGTVLLRSGKC